jgi:hypothetical protein
MTIHDVLVDTRFVTQGTRGPCYVVALKRCGCTGPMVGHVQSMTSKEVESAKRRGKPIPDEPEGGGTLWAGYAIGYDRLVVYAWGREECAQALCRWWGVRNIRVRLKRSSDARAAYVDRKRNRRLELTRAAA